MSKSIKLKDNTYWDTSGISHNRQVLKDILVVQNTDVSFNNLTINGTYNTSSNVYTSGDKQYWLYLGDLTFNSQGDFCYFNVCIGNGNNGNPEQNILYTISLQCGWVGNDLPIGITALCLQNYTNAIKIKIKHQSKRKVSIYMYIPNPYMPIQYEIHGINVNGASQIWEKKHEKLSSEPETDKEATYYSTIYKTDGTLSVFDVTTLNATTVNANEIKIGNIPRNTADTWIPVFKSGKLEHTLRVMPNGVTSSMYNTEQDRLVTLQFISFWNGSYGSDNYSNLKYCHQGVIQAFPTNLYENASGTNGTVTLSETAANFNHIQIFFNKTSDRYSSVDVWAPNGKNVVLELTYVENNNNFAQTQAKRMAISGSSITLVSNSFGGINFNGSSSTVFNNNELKIYKVLGYKH